MNREQETAMYDQPDDEGDEMSETGVQVCSICHRERTLDDVYDYHPLQVVMGQPVGWYTGDGDDVCSECMTKMLRDQ